MLGNQVQNLSGPATVTATKACTPLFFTGRYASRMNGSQETGLQRFYDWQSLRGRGLLKVLMGDLFLTLHRIGLL